MFPVGNGLSGAAVRASGCGSDHTQVREVALAPRHVTRVELEKPITELRRPARGSWRKRNDWEPRIQNIRGYPRTGEAVTFFLRPATRPASQATVDEDSRRSPVSVVSRVVERDVRVVSLHYSRQAARRNRIDHGDADVSQTTNRPDGNVRTAESRTLPAPTTVASGTDPDSPGGRRRESNPDLPV